MIDMYTNIGRYTDTDNRQRLWKDRDNTQMTDMMGCLKLKKKITSLFILCFENHNLISIWVLLFFLEKNPACMLQAIQQLRLPASRAGSKELESAFTDRKSQMGYRFGCV